MGVAIALDKVLLLVYYKNMDYSLEEEIIEYFFEK